MRSFVKALRSGAGSARTRIAAATFVAATALPNVSAAKSLIDYFQSTPIINRLSSSGWGASNVQPRDTDNGLEDRSGPTLKSWSYWDGRIVKAADGKYHMFASRWDQSLGHLNGWPSSTCVHAVSALSPLGPYSDMGACYSDAGGKGHNVMATQLADGSYFILVSETRQPAPLYSSRSLDGPWTSVGTIKVNNNGFGNVSSSSNTTFWPNPDGSILATSRNGQIMISTGGLTGTFTVRTNSVYDPAITYMPTGTPEDPCLWYSGGQYHMVYSYPLDRKMYHLTSPDGVSNWKDMGLAVDATTPIVTYTDGTKNVWNKLERPQVYLENEHVKYFTFAAIDVDKGNDGGNDNHGSKVIVVPFDGATFDAETGINGGGGAGGRGGPGGTGGRGAGGASGGGGRGAGGGGTGGSAGTAGTSGTGDVLGSGGRGGMPNDAGTGVDAGVGGGNAGVGGLIGGATGGAAARGSGGLGHGFGDSGVGTGGSDGATTGEGGGTSSSCACAMPPSAATIATAPWSLLSLGVILMARRGRRQ